MRPSEVCWAHKLWVRHPCRDHPLQINTHCPDGGASSNTDAFPVFAKRLIIVPYINGQDQ
jgi:hypothetical protein